MTQIAMRSTVPIVIADAIRTDMPLVLANDAFCTLTGRRRRSVIGRNCRFMQPKDGVGPVALRIRRFLDDRSADEGNFIIPNFRKDGTQFLNLLYLAKLNDASGTRFVLGSQFDISNEPLAALLAAGTQLHDNLMQMNTVLQGSGFAPLPIHDDLPETLAYVETYRAAVGQARA